jgi:DNA-binding Lrp family transcriptional regulator
MGKLGFIFGSEEKVKIMRLFIMNGDAQFEEGDIARKLGIGAGPVHKEVPQLLKAGFIRERKVVKEIEVRKGKKKSVKKVKVSAYFLNPTFEFLPNLRRFIEDVNPISSDEILKKLHTTGKLKFVALSGIFIKNDQSMVDLLIVGDNLKQPIVEKVIRLIEAEVGREVRYAAIETQEFQYRMSMYDKLVRDVLDFPYDALVDKLGISSL